MVGYSFNNNYFVHRHISFFFIQVPVVNDPDQSSVKLPGGWLEMNDCGSDKKFCAPQYQNDPGVAPIVVARSLVFCGTTWQLHIHGHRVDASLIPALSVFPSNIEENSIISDLLSDVDKLTVCVGNPEPSYVSLGKQKKNREFLSISKAVVAYLDSNAGVINDGQFCAITIRCVNCCLLIPSGVRCQNCQKFWKNLQTMHRRSLAEKNPIKNQKTNHR